MKPEQIQDILPIVKTKEEVYQEMRLRYKNSWKSPGYKNDEFSKPTCLRGNVLSEWQYERCFLAERSYKHPKQFKGFKGSIFSREFPEPSDKGLSQQIQKYLQIQQQNTKTIDIGLLNMENKTRFEA
ncbi:hypothetical protein IMG5_011240 [Ichthyophthirius multifiliis]|uniref:Uncharacterized protein n=1 Tax=Ichthyophthirius multifiliis TaxID=5932 RepID=G0QK10_ICHMU|nr:hypothetical protein IMG5_011240 [Ichthyophthirius multifiliis]EGR34447.1 hypothetical protein IMG5_011240 [Ichthyophthirius multifiliis]|eukprot:XP_004039751.1 hypothetical protein IMG5_011240 [Ichthyophthirius multifiliis]